MKHPKTGMTRKNGPRQDSINGGVKDFRAFFPRRSFVSKSHKHEKNAQLAARSAHLRTRRHFMDPPHGRRSLLLGRYPEICLSQPGSWPIYKTGFPAARTDGPCRRHYRDHRRAPPACRAAHPGRRPLVYRGDDRSHPYHQDRGVPRHFAPAPPSRIAKDRFLGRPA